MELCLQQGYMYPAMQEFVGICHYFLAGCQDLPCAYQLSICAIHSSNLFKLDCAQYFHSHLTLRDVSHCNSTAAMLLLVFLQCVYSRDCYQQAVCTI